LKDPPRSELFTMFDTKQFVKKIQNYPEIFDTTNAGFKQIDDKNGAWEKLAEEFKVDGEFACDFQIIA
jgi:Alcohol dehydrogenase transcription factor Myb/SANT-like